VLNGRNALYISTETSITIHMKTYALISSELISSGVRERINFETILLTTSTYIVKTLLAKYWKLRLGYEETVAA
jgi:ammonia channel protein AmtB